MINQLFQIYLNKGYQYFLNGSYRQAKKCFKEAYKIDVSKSLYSLYVLTEFRLNNFNKANNLAHEAYKLYSHDSEVVSNYATSCIWIGKISDAQEILIKYLDLYPRDYLCTINLGKVLFTQNKVAEALEKFLSLVDSRKNEDLFRNIAECFEILKNENEAYKYYKLVLELNPSDRFAINYFKKKSTLQL